MNESGDVHRKIKACNSTLVTCGFDMYVHNFDRLSRTLNHRIITQKPESLLCVLGCFPDVKQTRMKDGIASYTVEVQITQRAHIRESISALVFYIKYSDVANSLHVRGKFSIKTVTRAF